MHINLIYIIPIKPGNVAVPKVKPQFLFSVGVVECLFWTRVKRLHQHTHKSRNNMMLWWSKRIVVSCLTVSCVSPTDPQRLGRWMRREEEGLSQALSLLRQHWPAKRGQDAFRAWSSLLPRALFHSAEAGPGLDPLVVFLSPVWDCGWGAGAATGCWGWWGGEDEGCVIIILLAGSSEPEAAWCHLTLHPPFLLFVHAPFLPLSHPPVASYTVLSIQGVFFLSSTTSRVSSLRMSLLCPLSARVLEACVHTLSSAIRYLNCHLSLLSWL